MSLHYTARRPKINERSPYKQKLQTNAPGYHSKSNSTELLNRKSDRDGKDVADLRRVRELSRTSKEKLASADGADTDTWSGSSRPDVLSIDSDFDSGNCLTESPDQEPGSPTLTDGELTEEKRTGVSVGKNESGNFSFCTPPARIVSATVSRVRVGKKASRPTKNENPQPKLSARNVNLDPVSAARHCPSEGFYARSAVNEQPVPNSQVIHLPTSAAAGPGYASVVSSIAFNGRKAGGEVKSSDDGMDMKFADLTHQQLKRSLDQIHGQHDTRPAVGFPPNCGGDGSRFANGVSNRAFGAPHGFGDFAVAPSFAGHSAAAGVQTFVRNGCAYDAHEQQQQQPSKYDAILKVKDAMLQEKESVILKLRMQIASLEHQVQESDMALRQVVHSQTGPTSHSGGRGGAYSDLVFQKKIHTLEETLGKAEYELNEIKSRSDVEKNRLEETVTKLENSLKSREQALSEAKKKNKATSDRLEKYKKRVESLERYLGDLPTLEESNKLKTEAGLLGEERETLASKISDLEEKLRSKTLLLKDKEYLMEQCSEKEATYLKQIKHLEEKVTKLEKFKTELGRTERDELEDLKFDVDRLRREQESAARMISAHEKRMKQEREKQKEEIGSYQRKLEEAQDMNEHLRREQFLKQQTADKVHAAMMSLSLQNQELMEQKLDLQEKVKKLEKYRSGAEEEATACARLHRETAAAVNELKAVTQVLIQTAEGSDPNLSALLGIRSDVTSLADDPSRDDDDAPPLASVEQTNKSITDVRKLRRDLDQLRSTITNRYAENIGDNCTTQ